MYPWLQAQCRLHAILSDRGQDSLWVTHSD